MITKKQLIDTGGELRLENKEGSVLTILHESRACRRVFNIYLDDVYLNSFDTEKVTNNFIDELGEFKIMEGD